MKKDYTRLIISIFCSFLGLTLLTLISCGGGGSSSGGGGGSNSGQTWSVTFNDSGSAPHPQTVTVYVSPYTYSGTWGQSTSTGLTMYSPDGTCQYQLMVGGNVVHDSPGDRFSCVNLGGSGCGMQTIGSCSFTANGNFPNATSASGTFNLTTTSRLGTVSGTNTIQARRN